MNLLTLFLLAACGIFSILTAALPAKYERSDNVIVLEVASAHSDGDHREDRNLPGEEDSEPFQIVVPVARNFSSLDELYHILREDSLMKPGETTKAAPTYVKGTERNSSEYLLLMADSPGGIGGAK